MLALATSWSLHLATHEKPQNLADESLLSEIGFDGFASMVTTSPGRTGLRNFAFSIDTRNPFAFQPTFLFNQARQDWAMLSTRITPGTIGSPGKCPLKNASSPA